MTPVLVALVEMIALPPGRTGDFLDKGRNPAFGCDRAAMTDPQIFPICHAKET